MRYITPEQAIKHESGLEFLQPSEHFQRLGARQSYGCFGQLLNNPQFTSRVTMEGTAQDLDSVTMRKVQYSVAAAEGFQLDTGWKNDEGHFATVSEKSGKVYAYVSADYTPVNDYDAFKPLLDVARENDLKPVGRFDGMGEGKTRGHVIFTNPEFKVRLLEEYDDDIMLGVRMTNSYDLSAAVAMDVFGVRMVCINYNLWGRMLGYVYQPHVNFQAEHLELAIKGFLDDIIKKSPVLSQKAQKALEVEVVPVEIPDLLWSINLPKKGIESITAAPSMYNPDIEKMGLNMWTLYNGVTAYLTWGRDKGNTYLERSMDYSRTATDLLNISHDTLIEKGQEAREKYEERLRNREEKKDKPTVKVVRNDNAGTDPGNI